MLAEKSLLVNNTLYILIANFHHKKGCEIDLSYPSDLGDLKNNVCWKHIASLCLPDGAHNFVQDYVYLSIPSLNNIKWFGVSCYRQRDAKDASKINSEVTRSTIQKSICIISSLPLFGYFKMKLINAIDEYVQINQLNHEPQFIFKIWQEINTLLLTDLQDDFNLIYNDLSPLTLFQFFSQRTTMALLSYYFWNTRIFSHHFPTTSNSQNGFIHKNLESISKIVNYSQQNASGNFYSHIAPDIKPCQSCSTLFDTQSPTCNTKFTRDEIDSSKNENLIINNKDFKNYNKASINMLEESIYPNIDLHDNHYLLDGNDLNVHQYTNATTTTTPSFQSYIKDSAEIMELKEKSSNCANKIRVAKDSSTTKFYGDQTISSSKALQKSRLNKINLDGYGFPLAIYEAIQCTGEDESKIFVQQGLWCPYLSLPYMDLIAPPKKSPKVPDLKNETREDIGVGHIKYFAIGASNILFKQKALTLGIDVVVDLDNLKIEFPNETSFPNSASNEQQPSLTNIRKVMTLSSADVKFINYITRRIKLLSSSHATPVSPAPEKFTNSIINTSPCDDIEPCQDLLTATNECVSSQNSEIKNQNANSNDHPMINNKPGRPAFAPFISDSDENISPDSVNEANTVSDITSTSKQDLGNLEIWIRKQFHMYLVSLLSTTCMSDSSNRPKYEEDFNSFYVHRLKSTNAYQIWENEPHPDISEVLAGHPFQGNYNTLGEKLTNALALGNYGKNRLNDATSVATKKLGFAWNSTKSSLSSLFQ